MWVRGEAAVVEKSSLKRGWCRREGGGWGGWKGSVGLLEGGYGGGGIGFGSGTQGLQSRTSCPPPRDGLILASALRGLLLLFVEVFCVSSSPVKSTTGMAVFLSVESGLVAATSSGGCTMNCRGIVIRWGEQFAHTTRPHRLQWCLR